MLSQKSIELIRFLGRKNQWCTSNEIISVFKVSPRTIRNDVKAINTLYPALVLSSNQGYRINYDTYHHDLPSILNTVQIPNSYEERKKYILSSLLWVKKNNSIRTLSDDLFVSSSTIYNDLCKIKKEISKHNLYIRIKNNRVSIIGNEREKKKYIVALLNEEISTSLYTTEKLQKVFTKVDLKHIERIVTSILKKYEYFLDDYSLLNYVLHLAICIELGNVHNSSKSKSEYAAGNTFASHHIHEIVQDIYFEIQKHYHAYITKEEIFEASLLMTTRAISHHINDINVKELPNIVGNNVYEILMEIVVEVERTFLISLMDDRFLIKFAFHLNNLLTRVENNISISTLQFNSIKNDFPFIYVVGVYVANIIKERTKTVISEDEISYIALHLGVLMERIRIEKEKIRCIIVTANYNVVAKFLFEKLSEMFSDYIVINDMSSSISEHIRDDDCDLIISTIPLDESVAIPHVIISSLWSANDVTQVFEAITTIKDLKKKKQMWKNLNYFFRASLFFYDLPFQSSVEAIDHLCDAMQRQNLVTEDYKQLIYEHEEVAPSSYNKIAIPHPLSNKAKSSVIALSINPNPVTWGNNEVNIIFMLSLKEEDSVLFKDIFDFITDLIRNEKHFNDILNSRDFDSFIKTLISLSSYE